MGTHANPPRANLNPVEPTEQGRFTPAMGIWHRKNEEEAWRRGQAQSRFRLLHSVQTCATSSRGTDPSRPIGATAALPSGMHFMVLQMPIRKHAKSRSFHVKIFKGVSNTPQDRIRSSDPLIPLSCLSLPLLSLNCQTLNC